MNRIRVARPTDAASILEIYAPYIINTSFTFETEVPFTGVFAGRISSCLGGWPWLVYEVHEVVAGYAYAARHRERLGYQWSVESSIYIHDNFQKTGIGTALYEMLIEILQHQGFRNVYAGINLPNGKSVSFHEKCGFKWFADYENVGYKLGQWKTVGWWVKQINDYISEPPEPIKFSNLDPALVESILNKKTK